MVLGRVVNSRRKRRDSHRAVPSVLRSSSGDAGAHCRHSRQFSQAQYFINNPEKTKVTRYALQNAASVAGLILSTDAMVAELVEEKKGGGGHSHGMPDMGGMGGMDM